MRDGSAASHFNMTASDIMFRLKKIVLKQLT